MIEWVGGVVCLPNYVTGEGEPFRPDALVWLDANGAVIGMTVDRPGATLGTAASSLKQAMEQPMWGRPHVPTRVRVATAQLAAALRKAHPNIEVVCAATPELDAVLAALQADLVDADVSEQSYLSPQIDAKAMAALFHAAAGLFRAQPWSLICSDDCLGVTIDALGVRQAALSVIGQLGESLGFLLFASAVDFQMFAQAAQSTQSGERPVLPPHLALNFERGAELSQSLRKEIAVQGWEVAAANAYPRITAVDPGLIARNPTAQELSIAEALALALPQLLERKATVASALSGGPSLTSTMELRTHAGDVIVMLQVPHTVPADLDAVIAQLQLLGAGSSPPNAEVLRPLEDALMRHFAASAEASALDEIHLCALVMDLAASYFGATIVTLSPAQLREILFEIIPRKVSVPASVAGAIIQELQALYKFLLRAGRLKHAATCLRVLAGTAAKRLEAKLNDSGNFGIAKSLLMTARAAGLDLDSPEAFAAFVRSSGAQKLPSESRSSRKQQAKRGKPSPTRAKQIRGRSTPRRPR